MGSTLLNVTSFFTWGTIVAQLVVGLFSLFVYRRYLSPLADIPSPYLASISRWWHICRIYKGDQNLQLVALYEKHGHFVRIAPNEVSVSYLDGIKQIFLQPLWKGKWYELLQLPDYRFEAPMSTLDPKKKAERSRNLATGYSLSNVIRSEDAVTGIIAMLLEWMDKFADEQKPMDLDKSFTFTAFDVVGEILFSEQFGFLQQGIDIGHAIGNSLALNAYAAIGDFYSP